MGGRIYYGQTDYPLSAAGEAAARELGEFFLKNKISFDSLYSSDMTRARRTAELVAPGMDIAIVPELREICLGEWEGRSYDEVREEFAEIYEKRGMQFDSVAPPGGETFRELQSRTAPALEKILAAHESGNILVVAHGAAIWSLMAHHFGLNLNDMFFFALDYCNINVIEPTNGRMRLLRYNWSPLP